MVSQEILFATISRGRANALPFSGLGAAKPAPRFYADAAAATRSAATACSTASTSDELGHLAAGSRKCSCRVDAVPESAFLPRARALPNNHPSRIERELYSAEPIEFLGLKCRLSILHGEVTFHAARRVGRRTIPEVELKLDVAVAVVDRAQFSGRLLAARISPRTGPRSVRGRRRVACETQKDQERD